MTTFIEEPTASIGEIAKRAGLTPTEVQAEAAALGLWVGVDWQDRPAMSTRDAYALVTGAARQNHDHDAAFRAYTIALEQWQGERESTRRQAVDEAWKAAVGAGWGNSAAMDQGFEAGREAVAQFERFNPEPRFNEPQSRARSLLTRVKAGTR